jgi:hypothetical protein
MDTLEDQDRRVEDAKQSLLAHVEELGRRFSAAREKLDIKAHIAAHPRAAVGIAFAAGLLLGIPGGKRSTAVPSEAAVKTGMVGASMAALGSLVFTLVKNVALHHLSANARNWWDQRSAMESEASLSRDVESFLQH